MRTSDNRPGELGPVFTLAGRFACLVAAGAVAVVAAAAQVVLSAADLLAPGAGGTPK